MTPQQMQKIVDGAPEGSEMWRNMDSVFIQGEVLYYRWFGGALIVHDVKNGWMKSIYHDGFDYILDQLEPLSELRTELAKREPVDLRAVNIPHGTIILED